MAIESLPWSVTPTHVLRLHAYPLVLGMTVYKALNWAAIPHASDAGALAPGMADLRLSVARSTDSGMSSMFGKEE